MSFFKYKFLIIILFLAYGSKLFSQNNKLIDSLKIVVSKKQNDTVLINNYYLLADEYQKFDTKKSIEINKKVWELSKKNNYTKGYAHFFLTKSRINNKLEEYDLSKNDAQKSAILYLKADDKAGYLNAVYSESQTNIKMGQSDESIKIAINGLAFAKPTNLKYQIAKLNYCLGVNYHIKSDFKKSLYYLNLAIVGYRQLKLIDEVDVLNCYNQISGIYMGTNQSSKALEFIKMAIDLANKNNNNVVIYYYTNLVTIYTEMKDFKNALKYVKLAIFKSKSLNNKELLAFNTNSLARINFKQKNYDLGIENAGKAIKMTTDAEQVIISNQTLGVCYFAKNRFKRALEFQQTTLELIERWNNDNSNQIGRAHV